MNGLNAVMRLKKWGVTLFLRFVIGSEAKQSRVNYWIASGFADFALAMTDTACSI